MKKLIFVALALIGIFYSSCSKVDESQPKDIQDENVVEMYDIGIKKIHDEFCQHLVDSMLIWKDNGLTQESIESKVFDEILFEKLSERLEISTSEMAEELLKLGIT